MYFFFFVNVRSLKPLYFVDNSKWDIIYIYFNLEEKKLSIFQTDRLREEGEKDSVKDSVSVSLEMQT